MADARFYRCLTFPPATAAPCPRRGPPAFGVGASLPAPKSGEATRQTLRTGRGWVSPNPATASTPPREPSGRGTRAPRSSAPSGERYRATGLVIPVDHANHHLVRLVAARHLRVLDLRTEKNLDALQVDDQISTGQHPDVWDTCHRLADAVRRWWTDLDAIVYRSRITPESSANLAFFADDGFDIQSWLLADRRDILTDLVLNNGFTIGWDFANA